MGVLNRRQQYWKKVDNDTGRKRSIQMEDKCEMRKDSISMEQNFDAMIDLVKELLDEFDQGSYHSTNGDDSARATFAQHGSMPNPGRRERPTWSTLGRPTPLRPPPLPCLSKQAIDLRSFPPSELDILFQVYQKTSEEFKTVDFQDFVEFLQEEE